MITTSKYDVYLGQPDALQGYRVGSLARDSAPLVAPKFSSGREGETDLDLLKSTSISDFVGGMFQRDWTDETKVARLIGMYNPYDKMLYPALAPTKNTSSLGFGSPVAKVENELYAFVAFARYNAGSGAGFGWVSKLFKLEKSTGTLTAITLPTVYTTNGTAPICDLGLHNEYLYISAQITGNQINNYRMKVSDNTFQDLGGYGVIMRELRGVMYHIEIKSNIYSMSNETAASAATYTRIDVIGLSDPYISAPKDACEFNGALWIAKPDGIFRFDGMRATKVLNLSTLQLMVYNGAIYFVSKQWLYKFDGTNVTKLQFFGYDERFTKMSLGANSDYLFLQTFTPIGAFGATTDKASSGNGTRTLYTYDGQSFTIMYEYDMPGLYKPPGTAICYTQDTLFDIFTIAQSASDTAPEDMYYNRFDLQNYFKSANVSTTAQLELTTSEFDGGYPSVFKSINVFELNYRDMIAGDSITVSYQIFDGKTWGSWITLGTITSADDNRLTVFDKSKMLFKRVKVRAVATLAAGSTLKLKSASLRWTLQPRMRWRWQMMLIAHGLSITDRMGAATTDTANTLHTTIVNAIKSKTPLMFLSPDYGQIKTGFTAAATTFVLNGEVPLATDPYGENPFIAFKNANNVWEFAQVVTASYNKVNNETTVTVKARGGLVTAAAVADGAEFHLAFRVYVTRLVRDSPILDENTYDEQSTKNSELQREFQVELIEV